MHTHAKPAEKALLTSLFLIFSFAIIEALGGWWAHSLALLGDAGHMASDGVALGIAYVAARIAKRPPSSKHTFGLARAEVIAAWISSLILILITISIIVEAVSRLQNLPTVKGAPVMVIASIGLIINLFVAWLLSRSERSLNVRAALLHVLGDALGSIAALISGAVIYFTGWLPIDPILSIFIAILILISTIQLFRESITVLMEGVPRDLDPTAIVADMKKTPQLSDIHDFHIWTLATGRVLLTAHVMIDDMQHWPTILPQLQLMLRDKYHIEHITLQPEVAIAVLHYQPKHNVNNS